MPLYWLDPLGLYLDYPTRCFRVGPTDEAIGRVAQNPHIPTEEKSLAVASMKAWQCVVCLYEWGALRTPSGYYGPLQHGYTKSMLICGRIAQLIGSHATEDVPYKIGPILGWELSGDEFGQSIKDQWQSMGDAYAYPIHGLPLPEDAYAMSAFGQAKGTWAEWPTKIAWGVGSAAAVGALATGVYEVVTGESVLVEGPRGRFPFGRWFQIRPEGGKPWFGLDWKPFPGTGGWPVPHFHLPFPGHLPWDLLRLQPAPLPPAPWYPMPPV
jgi:hypothetical protein